MATPASPRSRKPIVGWAGSVEQMAGLVDALVERPYQVVGFDGPSHGRSDPGPSGPRRSNGMEFAHHSVQSLPKACLCWSCTTEVTVTGRMKTVSKWSTSGQERGWSPPRALATIGCSAMGMWHLQWLNSSPGLPDCQ